MTFKNTGRKIQCVEGSLELKEILLEVTDRIKLLKNALKAITC